jgi:hypothetical protein
VLVVCPTSVIDNWMRELDMWGAFKVMKFHGPPAVREALVEDASSGQYEVQAGGGKGGERAWTCQGLCQPAHGVNESLVQLLPSLSYL